MPSKTGPEQRRGTRIRASLRVRLVGLETEARLSTGDLSVSGIYFQCNIDPGAPGKIERLEISTDDGGHRLTVLACLIRVSRIQDLWSAHIPFGVAFEFLPEDAATQDAVRTLVEHVARERLEDSIESVLGLDLAAQISGQEHATQGGVRVTGLKQRALVLETSWPIECGTKIDVVLHPPHTREPLQIHGSVRVSQAVNDRFRIEVQVDDDTARVTGDDIGTAITSVLRGTVVPELAVVGEPRTPYLEGELDRVPLTSLLSLLELEHASGVLTVSRAGEMIVAYLRDGMVIDTEGTANESPRDALRRAIMLRDGRFKLDARRPERPARLSESTRALLLDLARQADEDGRTDKPTP